MSGVENVMDVSFAFAGANSPLSMAVEGEAIKYTVVKFVAHCCSWIPILGAVVGIARIVFGAKLAHQLPSVNSDNKLWSKVFVGTTITRGALEVITLGFVAPLFIVIDCISMISLIILLKLK